MLDNNYDVVLCDTHESKCINYRIRYQVYCLERGYEHADNYPELMESDYYDDFSVHFIVRDHNTNSWIGACRMVIHSFDKLPLFKHCSIENHSLYKKLLGTSEISRLSLLSLPRLGSHKVSGIILNTLINYCQNHGIQHCFSLHSRSMARMLKFLKIDALAISQECDFRGLRRVYYHKIPLQQKKSASVEKTVIHTNTIQYQSYSEFTKLKKLSSASLGHIIARDYDHASNRKL